MFKKIKSFFNSVEPNNDTGEFYPLMNSNYKVNELSRTDYLALYTGWVYVAVSTISDSVAELDFVIKSKGSDKEINHPYSELIDYDFLKKTVSYLLLNGNAFLLKEQFGTKIDSLYFFRPDLVNIELNIDGSLRGYRYTGFGKNYMYLPDDIINFQLFSPMETYPGKVKGVSPMQAVAIQAEMDRTANRWNWNFFKNGGSVRDILRTDHSLSKEVKQRILSKWKSDFQGVNNSHKLAILDNGLQYETANVSQKELDFVESRRFTRDEILSIFKLPKSIIGIADDVNRANSLTAENTYYRSCIRPLARQIENTLNKYLFLKGEKIEFVNIVPKDTEQLLLDFNNGALTINEYRQELGYGRLKDGDRLKLNEFQSMPFNNEKEKKEVNSTISDILKKNIKGTEEYRKAREELGLKRWTKRQTRTDKYEIKFKKAVDQIFAVQKADYLKRVNKKLKTKQQDLNIKYKALWLATLTPIYREIMMNEGNEALNDIGIVGTFTIGTSTTNKFIKESILRMSDSIDNTTKEKLIAVLQQGQEEGLSSVDLSKLISSTFENFSQKRSIAIARTEVINASTGADIEAWDQYDVKGKEWWTALDERVCEFCGPMHGKTVGLRKNFFDKDGQMRGEEGGSLDFGYREIQGPTLHTNCRCTLIPIL